jgi:hypothetical protein
MGERAVDYSKLTDAEMGIIHLADLPGPSPERLAAKERDYRRGFHHGVCEAFDVAQRAGASKAVLMAVVRLEKVVSVLRFRDRDAGLGAFDVEVNRRLDKKKRRTP